MSDEPNGEGQRPQRVVREFQKRRRTLPRWECVNATYSVRASLVPERREDLTRPDLASIMRGALHHQDGRRFALHFYSIMPDHLHAVVEPLPRDDGCIPLPEIMHALKSYTAHQINRTVGTRGTLWLDEGFNRIIRSQEEYWDWYNCIWLNPWRAGLVDDPHDWPWWWERPHDR